MENKRFRHLVNLVRNKRTGALFTGANGKNIELQLPTQKLPNATQYPNK